MTGDGGRYIAEVIMNAIKLKEVIRDWTGWMVGLIDGRYKRIVGGRRHMKKKFLLLLFFSSTDDNF